jgi:hypothetical protein
MIKLQENKQEGKGLERQSFRNEKLQEGMRIKPL